MEQAPVGEALGEAGEFPECLPHGVDIFRSIEDDLTEKKPRGLAGAD